MRIEHTAEVCRWASRKGTHHVAYCIYSVDNTCGGRSFVYGEIEVFSVRVHGVDTTH